jgi:hypothetical protein
MEKSLDVTIAVEGLTDLIYTIRGVQVMIDRDLAQVYRIENKRLNEQVKRNSSRFPDSFRFQLTDAETVELVANCDRFQPIKHSSSNPYAFTEQGVAMLSAVLRSDTAIQTSIQIINAFVAMRRFIGGSGNLLHRMENLEHRQISHEIRTDQRFEQVFEALEQRLPPTQGVFFDGQLFDAYRFINDLLRQARRSIVLIDNYVDDTVLAQLDKRAPGVSATILTKSIGKTLAQDLKRHNQQYPPITAIAFDHSHDRFLILDDETVYHLGASLKDLGKRWFAFTKMEKAGLTVMERVEGVIREHLEGAKNGE